MASQAVGGAAVWLLALSILALRWEGRHCLPGGWSQGHATFYGASQNPTTLGKCVWVEWRGPGFLN